MTRTAKGLLFFVAAMLLGLAIFGLMVYRAVDVEAVEPQEAALRFAATKAGMPPGQPLLVLDDAGNVVRREEPRAAAPGQVSRLRVLAYHAGSRRLASASVAMWFLRIKAPAAQLAFRDTGFDLERLGLTAAEVSRLGPSLIVDSIRSNGDRLLVWTER